MRNGGRSPGRWPWCRRRRPPLPGMAGSRSFLRPAGLVALPVADPAIGVARRRLRGLGLDPADPFVARVVEAVDRAGGREGVVTGPERVVLAVELALDRAGEEDVRLLERVVVGLGRAAQL